MSGKYARQSEKKFPWVPVAAVLVVLAVAAVILIPKLWDSQSVTDMPTEPAVQQEPTDPVLLENTEPEQAPPVDQTTPTDAMQTKEPVTDLQVDTPYCTLHYPAQWNGCVKMVTDQQPDRFSVTFVGMIGEHEADLFAIVFGESTEMPVGTLVQNDGAEITVRLNVDMFVADDNWSDDETSQAYEMIGDSAYVLEALAELENFR